MCKSICLFVVEKKGEHCESKGEKKKNFMECEMEAAVVGRRLRLYCSAVVALVRPMREKYGERQRTTAAVNAQEARPTFFLFLT